MLVLEADHGRLLRHEEILAALGYEPVGFTGPRKPSKPVQCARASTPRSCATSPAANSALEFATKLRKLAPNLPIILATASARDLEAPLLAASGVSEVVHHPLTSADLAGALSRCLTNPVAARLQS